MDFILIDFNYKTCKDVFVSVSVTTVFMQLSTHGETIIFARICATFFRVQEPEGR